jgi:hypothetical protein
MVKFDKWVRVIKSYDVNVVEFMSYYYQECNMDWNDDNKVLVYIKSDGGLMSYAFSMPLIEGKNIDDKYDVAYMITEHFKGDTNE